MQFWPTTPERLRARGIVPSYWPGQGMALDHDHCFLCAVKLTGENRTDEHVISRWLQQDYDLWNLSLTLLNRTSIRYRQLKIPACRQCNSFWLATVERQVAEAFRSGPAAVEALDQTLLCLWLAKVYYGLHFKQLALAADRGEPNGASILEPSGLARHSELHHLLQAVRRRVRFPGVPGSVRIFRSQVPAERQLRFDYRDLREAPFIAVRVGPTVVIASLLDWGAMNEISDPYLDAAAELVLHPWQFHEVAAHGAYLALRCQLRFGYLIDSGIGDDALQPVLVAQPRADPAAQPFAPFRAEEFAIVLAEFTGLPLEDIFRPETDQVWSNLITADGEPRSIDLARVPANAKLVPPSWDARHRDDDDVERLGEL